MNPVGTILREPRHVIAVLRVLVLAGITMLGLSSRPEHPYVYWVLTVVYAVLTTLVEVYDTVFQSL